MVKDVDELLNRSSIFAFPSILEGFPNALSEAMASGLPCVSFNCDTGPSDLINDGKNGYLVDVGDIDMFSLRLRNLMESESLRANIALEAIKIREQFHISKISNLFLDFLDKN